MNKGNSIQKSTTNQLARAKAWTNLKDDVLKREASKAANTKDFKNLWGLLEAYTLTYGKAGAKISKNTLRAYKRGLESWLEFVDSDGVNILRPERDTGLNYTRQLEATMSASSVRVRLAAIKMLYRALRWSGATEATPFVDVKPAKDKTAAHDKRQPYTQEELDTLLASANSIDTALILLCAHAGLRVSEAVALEWDNIKGDILKVIAGKGNKDRIVNVSSTLKQALQDLKDSKAYADESRLLPFTTTRARARIKALAKRCGVEYKGVHAFRHYAGTRLYRETKDLENTARHLGHSDIETTRIYAKWSDTELRASIQTW